MMIELRTFWYRNLCAVFILYFLHKGSRVINVGTESLMMRLLCGWLDRNKSCWLGVNISVQWIIRNWMLGGSLIDETVTMYELVRLDAYFFPQNNQCIWSRIKFIKGKGASFFLGAGAGSITCWKLQDLVCDVW